MAEEIPVYLFTGFMDSGKTTLVQETLFENEFAMRWFKDKYPDVELMEQFSV